MEVFHGSDIIVDKPQILTANRLLDFGEGFYTTSSYEQAKRWAQKVSIRRKTSAQIITKYNFNLEAAQKNLKIIEFLRPDQEWLDFITACRNGKLPLIDYDIAIGPVANDTVYSTIRLYETGVLNQAETVARLKVETIGNQILFHTAAALPYCKFLNAEQIYG
ncbi:MAG: DUF3990 domain-containing protein [Candidatus Margulisbacteria bacterium]|jgi:hypothetical protein|nr:DUF3990 domain-containing protein [Candidatus Margulisiibacteriota bacterium]